MNMGCSTNQVPKADSETIRAYLQGLLSNDPSGNVELLGQVQTFIAAELAYWEKKARPATDEGATLSSAAISPIGL